MPLDERLVFYEGKFIRLKALCEQDILESNWAGWFNDDNLCQFNQHHRFPNTLERQRNFLTTLENDQEKFQLGVVDKAHPECICGVVSLNGIDWFNRNADFAALLDPRVSDHNPALFFEALSILLRHGFDQFGLNKITTGSFRPNIEQALQATFNFEKEGILHRHVFKNGQFHDVVILAVFMDSVKYPDF